MFPESLQQFPPVEADPDRLAVFWAERLGKSMVPSYLHDGLINYFARRIRPGSFLTAVLENNLRVALGKADPLSRAAFADILEFLVTTAPYDSWGSEDAVTAWVKGEAS